MAISRKGILGGFSGKAGNMIGRSVAGQDVLTGLHEKPSVPPTQLQTDQRLKLGLVSGFFSYIPGIINLGFKPRKKKHGPMNAAVAYHLKHAVTGDSPDFSLSYPQVCISKGLLIKPYGTQADALTGAILNFTWTASEIVSPCNNTTDQLMIMVYNPSKHEFATLLNAAARIQGSCSLQLPADFSGDRVHAYLAFVNDKGLASDSIYAGEIYVQ